MAKLVKKIKKEVKEDLVDVSEIKGLKVIELNTRKFVQYDFDFAAKNAEITQPIIPVDEIKDAVVKISIKIRQEDMYKINVKELEDNIKQHAFIVKPIVTSIQKEKRIRMKEITTDLNPLEAVKVWLLNKKHKDADLVYQAAEEIIRAGESI